MWIPMNHLGSDGLEHTIVWHGLSACTVCATSKPLRFKVSSPWVDSRWEGDKKGQSY